MQYITKLKLASIHKWCDAEDKSTEYMYQLMQDMCKVDSDTVNNYFMLSDKEKTKLFKELMDLLQTIQEISNI